MCFIVVFLKFNLFKKKKTSNCDNNASIYCVEVVIQIFIEFLLCRTGSTVSNAKVVRMWTTCENVLISVLEMGVR